MAIAHEQSPIPLIDIPAGLATGGGRSTPVACVALVSMLSVQLGAAASTPLIGSLGAAGAAWLRLSWAALIFVLIARPRLFEMAHRDLLDAILLGMVSAGMTLLFFAAIARIPLATAVACEFLGPLAVAVVRRSGRHGLIWPTLAGAGVLLVTQPWQAVVDLLGVGYALGAALCWAGYIVFTQRVGHRIAGLSGLAISMPVAALVAAVVAAPQSLHRVTPDAVVVAAGLALLLPVIPYALELLALRRLETAAFGTLMSVEPVVALVVGVVVLGQVPRPIQAVGVLFITVAATGAARSPARPMPVAQPTQLKERTQSVPS